MAVVHLEHMLRAQTKKDISEWMQYFWSRLPQRGKYYSLTVKECWKIKNNLKNLVQRNPYFIQQTVELLVLCLNCSYDSKEKNQLGTRYTQPTETHSKQA